MRSTTYGELLGVAIRHYRTGLRLNQGEAARRAELTQSTWSKLERGSVGVTVETLRNTLAPSLRVHPSDLLDLADRLEEAATARGMMVLEGPSPARLGPRGFSSMSSAAASSASPPSSCAKRVR